MKRKLFVLSLLLVLLAALLVPAGAETLDNVTDFAGLLTGAADCPAADSGKPGGGNQRDL